MTIKWFQLVGGSRWHVDGSDFSGAVESRAWQALQLLEAEILDSYDGARWLAQEGYERVALGLEYRSDKKGRALRSIGETGRLLSPDYSVVWPELGTATVEEMVDYLRPVVLEALEHVGERKKLGSLPKAGEGDELTAVPLKPLIEDPAPYDEEPGDSFVITRDFPPGTDESRIPALLRQYDKELDELLSDGARDNVLDVETSSSGVRWVVRITRRRRR